MKEIALSPQPLRTHEEIEQLRAKNQQLERFLEIGKLLGSERNIDKLLPLIMHETSNLLAAERSTVFLLDHERMELWTKFAEGLNDQRIVIELKMGVTGLCAITGRLLNIPDAYTDARFNQEIDVITGYRTQSIMCAPIFGVGGEVLGVIELLNKKTGVFTKEDEKKVLSVAKNFAEMIRTSNFIQEGAGEIICNLRESTGCDRGDLFILERGNKRLCSVVAEGMSNNQSIRLDLNLGIAGYVALTGQEVNVEDAYTDPRFDRTSDLKTGYRTRCILCVPIRNQAGEILGVVQAINKNNGVFTDADLDLLRSLSPQISIPIENAILFYEQNLQFQSMLEVLAASIDAKDPLTAGHSQKVAEYAVGIARELGFGETELDVLNIASLLHDYGKIGVSDSVLKKPGQLNDEEYKQIKEHVTYTRNILSRMHFMRKYRNVPLIASCHHERLDGSGYDGGMKGYTIPYMAKILAVADVFEALTAKRHYREALSAQTAFDIMDKDAEIHYDGNILEALKTYWQKRHYE